MLSEQVEFERRNANNVPLTSQRCFHPVRVFNRYMNEYVYVNCRKCDGCLSARSAELTARVANECKQHTYSIFFTLTYDNEHLPVMRFHSRNLFLGNRPIGYDRLSRSYLYPSFDVSEIEDFDLSVLVPTNYPTCDGFAYANKYDVQKWLMRLRSHIMRNQEFKYTRVNKQIVRFLGTADYIKNLSKDEKTFRYFICSEYGPQYFRPHYHGIIWCDSEPLARYLLKNILEDWSLGSKTLDKPSLVNSSAPSYVAKYVNGSTRLPKILQTKSFHSFVLASKNPIIGSYKNDLLQVTDAFINGVVEQLQPVDKREPCELAFVPISTALCSRYFPKCSSYRETDVYGKLSIFEKYRKGNFRKEFRLNPDGSKVLVNSTLQGLRYINSLGYKYQDFRFYMMANFWTSRLVSYPERVNGILTGKILQKRLSIDEYIALLDRLYSNLALLVLRGFYTSQVNSFKFFNDENNALFNLFSYYPDIFYELPYSMLEEEWTDSRFDDFFSTFDVHYKMLYNDDGWLDLAFVNYVQNNGLQSTFRSSITHSVNASLKNKKYNEFYHEL